VFRLRYIPFFVLAAVLVAQGPPVEDSTFENYPSVTLANGKVALTIMRKGSTLANLVLTDDPEKFSPFWNPMRMSRELGREPKFDGGAGLFVCVDGFGPPSDAEKAAGLPGHGEAHSQVYDIQSSRAGAVTSVTAKANLPILQEVFTRTFRAVDGENVIYVSSELESKLGFDHPVNWAEHATIGSPFLESGATVVDISGSRSRTRPYPQVNDPQGTRRLASGQDFTWPLAPGLNGKSIDLRETPDNPHYVDHATTLLDPGRELEWASAINVKKRLILGYVFKRVEYPWLQYWGYYPATQKFARGMEFGTQPFDVPRREVISAGSMFDTPRFRWLPAKSTIQTHFLLFYARVPENFRKVDDVRLEGHQLLIEDKASHQQVTLNASLDL